MGAGVQTALWAVPATRRNKRLVSGKKIVYNVHTWKSGMRIHVWTCSFLDKLSKQQRVRQKGMEVYRKMKNKIRAALIIAVTAGICCVLNRLPAAATQSEIDKVNENINELEQEQEESRQELTDLEADKAYLDGKLKSLNSQLSAAAQELSGLQEQL